MSDIRKMKRLSQELVQKSKGSLVAPSEVLKKIEVLAPEALDTLESLMTSSKADSVRLKAALEILALAGVTKETRLTIKTDVQDMDSQEIDSRLAELLGKASGVTLEGEAKDVTPAEKVH